MTEGWTTVEPPPPPPGPPPRRSKKHHHQKAPISVLVPTPPPPPPGPPPTRHHKSRSNKAMSISSKSLSTTTTDASSLVTPGTPKERNIVEERKKAAMAMYKSTDLAGVDDDPVVSASWEKADPSWEPQDSSSWEPRDSESWEPRDSSSWEPRDSASWEPRDSSSWEPKDSSSWEKSNGMTSWAEATTSTLSENKIPGNSLATAAEKTMTAAKPKNNHLSNLTELNIATAPLEPKSPMSPSRQANVVANVDKPKTPKHSVDRPKSPTETTTSSVEKSGSKDDETVDGKQKKRFFKKMKAKKRNETNSTTTSTKSPHHRRRGPRHKTPQKLGRPANIKPGESYMSTPHSAEIVVRNKVEMPKVPLEPASLVVVDQSPTREEREATAKEKQEEEEEESSGVTPPPPPPDEESFSPPSFPEDEEQAFATIEPINSFPPKDDVSAMTEPSTFVTNQPSEHETTRSLREMNETAGRSDPFGHYWDANKNKGGINDFDDTAFFKKTMALSEDEIPDPPLQLEESLVDSEGEDDGSSEKQRLVSSPPRIEREKPVAVSLATRRAMSFVRKSPNRRNGSGIAARRRSNSKEPANNKTSVGSSTTKSSGESSPSYKTPKPEELPKSRLVPAASPEKSPVRSSSKSPVQSYSKATLRASLSRRSPSRDRNDGNTAHRRPSKPLVVAPTTSPVPKTSLDSSSSRHLAKFAKRGRKPGRMPPPTPEVVRTNNNKDLATTNRTAVVVKKSPATQARFRRSLSSPAALKASSSTRKQSHARKKVVDPHQAEHAIVVYGVSLKAEKRRAAGGSSFREKKRVKPVKKQAPVPSDMDVTKMDPLQLAGFRLLNKAAIPIQSAIRRYLAQKAAVNRLWAMIEIQSYFRRWRSEAYLFAHQQAAIKIQAAFRGWTQRDLLEEEDYCAIMIQKIVRGYLASASVYDDLYRVFIVQKAVRARLARTVARDRLQKIVLIQTWYRECCLRRCATVIQAQFRAYSAQLHFQFDIVDIIIVQSIARRWKACRRVQTKQTERDNKAATIIQTKWRSFHAYSDFVFAIADILIVQRTMRRWLASRHVATMREEKMVILVQSHWRRYQAQMNALYKLVRIIIVQSVARRWLAIKEKQDIKDREAAALRVQAAWRRFWQFSQYLILQYEAVRIQSIFRGNRVRQETDFQIGCVIMLQAVMRRYLAPAKVRRMKVSQAMVASAAVALREKNACRDIVTFWRCSKRKKKEQAAALTIERFFLMVKREVDKEIRRHHRKEKSKRERRRRAKRETDDTMLERAWLNTVDGDGHGGGRHHRSRSVPRGGTGLNDSAEVPISSVDDMGWRRTSGYENAYGDRVRHHGPVPPTDAVRLRDSDDVSEVTTASGHFRHHRQHAPPSRHRTFSGKQMHEDLNLEEAWIDTEIRQAKGRRRTEEEYIQRHGLQHHTSYRPRDDRNYYPESHRAHHQYPSPRHIDSQRRDPPNYQLRGSPSTPRHHPSPSRSRDQSPARRGSPSTPRHHPSPSRRRDQSPARRGSPSTAIHRPIPSRSRDQSPARRGHESPRRQYESRNQSSSHRDSGPPGLYTSPSRRPTHNGQYAGQQHRVPDSHNYYSGESQKLRRNDSRGGKSNGSSSHHGPQDRHGYYRS